MLRFVILFSILAVSHLAFTQRLLTKEEAVALALNNQRNLRAAGLSVQQQQQLLRGAAGVTSPQVFGEVTPYEPLTVGVQQTFNLPGVYRNRRVLQSERIRLAQLQLNGTQYELKRDVRLSFLQLQYLQKRSRILKYQDSIYQAIKSASKRFFDAGQINKLEELQATTQADAVRNDLTRVQVDIASEMQLFRFYTNLTDSFTIDTLETYAVIPKTDTPVSNVQQQILQQQIALSQSQLQVERSELLPQIQAGVLFPTTKSYERPVGFQVGITLPIWQSRSRIAAAQTGVEIARAQQELEHQRLNAQYRQAFTNYERELQSLLYFKNTALPQAGVIIETSQRLFKGGELNYIESLRNLQSAFDIFQNHIDTHRAYNEAVIQLNYLNGTL